MTRSISLKHKIYILILTLFGLAIGFGLYIDKNENQKASKIVYITLKGGLGNQMFQYAAGYALAKKIGANVCVHKSGLRQKDRPYQLDIFNISSENCTPRPKMKKFLRLLPSFLTNAVFYKEPFFHYDPHFLKQDPYQKRYFINGYFQSPLYFNHVKADIKTIYQLKKPFSQKAKQIQEKIQTTVIPVSIHFRAGDYLTKENAKVHNVMDESYYKRAVAIMQKMYGEKVHFFIFSDDPKAAKALFHWLLQKDIIEPDPEHPEEDLFLMSFCHHHILANSSYSWWGAWLNNNLKKTVIAPLHWVQRDVLLKDSRLDLYDEGWIILK